MLDYGDHPVSSYHPSPQI